VEVEDGSRPQRLVLAKVRRGWTAPERADGARPRLAPTLLPAAEQTALEFAGLTAVYEVFGNGDPDFGAIRPLEHLAADDTILMEYVDAPTLRNVLLRRNRLAPPIGRAAHHRGNDAWRRAGAWLRVFQQQMPRAGLPARQATREEVVDRFEAFSSFLTSRLGARSSGEAARTGASLAAAVLPERRPLAVGTATSPHATSSSSATVGWSSSTRCPGGWCPVSRTSAGSSWPCDCRACRCTRTERLTVPERWTRSSER
jgi:hypothetical protein